jgi:hypothetical protein
LSPFLEEYDGFIVDLRDDVSLVVEALDKFPDGPSVLFYNASQVPFNA